MADALLELHGVRAGYGPTVVLDGVDLSIAPGEALALIGRNGVGKTTLLATAMGRTRLHAGAVRFAGQDVSRWPGWRRARAGLGHVPQEREVFPSLSVAENLAVADRRGARGKAWSADRVAALFPRLRERARQRAGLLSGGEQQMLAIARALMLSPRLLLLDEPLEGLAPVLVDELMAALAALRRDPGGPAMLLVEQNVDLALGFADRTVVLHRGRVVHEGPAAALAADAPLLERLVGVAAA